MFQIETPVLSKLLYDIHKKCLYKHPFIKRYVLTPLYQLNKAISEKMQKNGEFISELPCFFVCYLTCFFTFCTSKENPSTLNHLLFRLYVLTYFQISDNYLSILFIIHQVTHKNSVSWIHKKEYSFLMKGSTC